jgi:hypothetical protein
MDRKLNKSYDLHLSVTKTHSKEVKTGHLPKLFSMDLVPQAV